MPRQQAGRFLPIWHALRGFGLTGRGASAAAGEGDSAPRRCGAGARLLRMLHWLLVGLAIAAAACWMVGWVLSDRFVPSQFAKWVPPAMLLPIVASAAIVAASRRRRRTALAFGLVAAAMVTIHLRQRWSPFAPCRDGVRIVHWNAASPRVEESAPARASLASLEADLLLVSNDWGLFGRLHGDRWPETGQRVHRAGPFAIASRLPLLEVRLAVASKQRFVAVVRLDATAEIGRPLVVWLVDLPSDPRRPRMAEARALRTLLDGLRLPPPDLVAGDFNMDAGSVALQALLPGLRDAFAEAGRGYAGSYPRELPLWQPDQMAVAPTLRICSYRLVDLGWGRHRAQELMLPRRTD